MEPVKVIVHLISGKVIKGYTNDFNPNIPSFHLMEQNGGTPSGKPIVLNLKELKGVFFVKSFEGNKDYQERKEFVEGDRAQGRRVKITFSDGETLQGSTVGYDKQRIGFFLMPVDPGSNNIRIFVINSEVKEFQFL